MIFVTYSALILISILKTVSHGQKVLNQWLTYPIREEPKSNG